MIRPGSREHSARTILLLTGDAIVALLALFVAVHMRRSVPLPLVREMLAPLKFPLNMESCALFGGAFVVALAMAGFHRRRMMTRARPLLLVALLLQIAIVTIVGVFVERPLPRSLLVLVPLLEALLFPLWRALQNRIWPVRPRETILVGATRDVAAAVSILERSRDRRVRVSGYVSPEAFDSPLRWLGDTSSAHAAIRSAEEVVCVSEKTSAEERLALLRIRGPRGYLMVASHADALLISNVLGWMGDEPLFEVAVACGFGARAVLKRAFDLVGATLLLVATSPLWLLIALGLLLDQGRPILLRQARVGLNNRTFGMWKFRTMRAAENGESDRERTTRFGRLLRRHRLDELPQLLNVLSGEMSLVGPRPEQPDLAAAILRDVPDFDLRCLVRPGIAGLAQILAEYESRPAVKLRYDLTYMCSWSLWLDIRLLFSSVATALSGSGI